MSFMPTDEQNAYYKGRSEGFRGGQKKSLDDLEKWLELDEGMIPVGSIREKIRTMREKI